MLGLRSRMGWEEIRTGGRTPMEVGRLGDQGRITKCQAKEMACSGIGTVPQRVRCE